MINAREQINGDCQINLENVGKFIQSGQIINAEAYANAMSKSIPESAFPTPVPNSI